MSTGAPAPEPAVVEIRVTGAVGELGMAGFEGFTSVVEPVSTTLRGPVSDQAELHGLLIKIRDLGVRLLSVHACDATGQAGGRPV